MARYAVPLPWDTEFFGFKVARLVPGRFVVAELKLQLAQLWEQEVELVYWGSDPEDSLSQTAATANHGLLVDRKTVFVRRLDGFVGNAVERYEVRSFPKDGWSDVLAKLAVQIGQYSRFHKDHHFSSATWQKLYLTWMQNSVNRTIADDVLVIRDAGLVVAVVTVRARENFGEIGLLGVQESRRGAGLGRALVDAAMHWFSEKQLSYVRVVTQGDNQLACQLYKACGFSVDSVENFYHFWNPLNDSFQ
jgi:dTDP-4-amino-4,6-dideoxy-D-galactose acyltransferase